MIAIVVALSEELRPLLRRLSARRSTTCEGWRFHCGTFGGREAILCASGIGIKSARDAADVLLCHYEPDALLCAGVAGALSPAAALNDIVVGSEIFQAHLATGVEPARVFVKPRYQLIEPSAAAAGGAFHCGGVVTCDRLAATAQEKHAIFQKTAALVVEMETAAVAQVAADRRLPFLAVRVISDTAEESLPGELNALHRDGRLQWGRVVSTVVSRPAAARQMARLGRRAARASQRLAQFLEEATRSGVITALARVPQAIGCRH
jgi:adenosylhomocysteine nucleosidase